MTEAPVPQHLAIVLPSTGEFDSRTYRIATGVLSRGHRVTVLARHRPGLPQRERHPAGYDVIRVPVSAWRGLPLPGPAIDLGRRVLRRGQPAAAAGPAAASAAAAARVQATDAEPALGPTRRGVLGRIGGARVAFVRTAAIALVVRSQAKATRRVAPRADLYHGMAYMGVPVALELGRRHRAPVTYDARDIYLDAGNLARLPRPARAVIGRLERRWARRANRVVTVNRPYAEVMAERFGVPLPLIVLNCSYRFDPPEPRERRFHLALGLPAETRVILYQGGFSPDRGIEQLIEAIASVDGAVLVLLGYGALRAELERCAADPATGGRVRVLAAVPPDELLSWVAAADVVAMPIQPTTLNHRLTTPNKLFEAMAAGVPALASDLPGMADIVRETGAGRLVDPTDPAAIAAALRELLADEPARAAIGRQALVAAHATYNWERQLELLLGEYGRLTGRPW